MKNNRDKDLLLIRELQERNTRLESENTFLKLELEKFKTEQLKIKTFLEEKFKFFCDQ
jgi:hypothetical protein